jgi:hypothetical protein
MFHHEFFQYLEFWPLQEVLRFVAPGDYVRKAGRCARGACTVQTQRLQLINEKTQLTTQNEAQIQMMQLLQRMEEPG